MKQKPIYGMALLLAVRLLFMGGGSLKSQPPLIMCWDQFKVHEISMSIDLAPLIFFPQQIFEILISQASEFLIDEKHSEETVDDKVGNLASF